MARLRVGPAPSLNRLRHPIEKSYAPKRPGREEAALTTKPPGQLGGFFYCDSLGLDQYRRC
jgi:hypothetical protein